ncbi:hypothetical protein UFOVP73_34 [uncultured Caudovirales phage]|uniref:Uncharacterized protein n=1 Tax=uncultured Caudovirales phage TaxID=2100421 RepID=A0A6J5L278_9CAUD|nr:hypothetical protein UFOVP73_34 [uncultured Caudovirales phage]CAB5195166.1 hypothetical protein UFOVP170_56 [uncultured Caudovirales phage]
MDGRTTPRVKRLMEMAARPGGVLSREVEPDAVRAVTEAGQRMVAAGWLTVERVTRWDSRFSCTPEAYRKWVGEPKPAHAPTLSKGGRRLGADGLPTTWSITSSIRSAAWWDKSARPGHPDYVEPRITSDTKVTLCKGFSGTPPHTNTYSRST